MNATTSKLDAVTYHRAGQILAAILFAKQPPIDVMPNEMDAVREGGWVHRDAFSLTTEGMAFAREFLAEEGQSFGL